MMRVPVLEFIFLSLYFSVRPRRDLSARRLLAGHLVTIAPPRLRRMLRTAGNIARRKARSHCSPAVCALNPVNRDQQDDMLVAVGEHSPADDFSPRGHLARALQVK